MRLNIFKSQIPTVLFNLTVLCFGWDIVRQDRCKLVSRPVYVYIGLGLSKCLCVCGNVEHWYPDHIATLLWI